MLFKISRKKEKTQFNSIDLTVLNLFDFILVLTFYIMTLLEYLALNTHDNLSISFPSFTFMCQISKCHQTHSLESASLQEAIL